MLNRKLYRVPLDFEWPRRMIWKGFVTPYKAQPCTACERTGLNPPTKRLHDRFHALGPAWVEELKRADIQILATEWPRYYNNLPIESDGLPSLDQFRLWAKNSGEWIIYMDIIIRLRAKAGGYYGYCEYCAGNGKIWHSPEFEKAAAAWVGYDPPTGPGYQLWETTSEGSPISPVFETLEELCAWAAINETIFADLTLTAERWYAALTSS